MEEETIITEEAPEERKGSGRGFAFGITLGALAGAAAATLFAPATGEEIRQRFTDDASLMPGHPEGESALEGGQPGTPVERIRAVLARVRSRVQEASEEGRLATEEAVAGSHARYAELTHQEEPQG